MEEKPATTELPEQLRLLESNARALAAEGRHDDAERLLREVVNHAPRHLPALQYLASRAILRKELEKAQAYIESAIRAEPRTAVLHQNLGIILRARGFLEGALVAFDAALRCNPKFSTAWIQRGDILQSLGRRNEAIASYKRAEELGGDLNSMARANAQTPRKRRTLQRAAHHLAQAREAEITGSLDPLLQRHGQAALARIRTAIRGIAGHRSSERTDALQKPTLAHIPELGARPFINRRELPFLEALENKSAAILGELRPLLQNIGLAKAHMSDSGQNRDGNPQEAHRAVRWTSYHLYRAGKLVPNLQCPETLAAVTALPLARLPQLAPDVGFLILAPHAHLSPRHGLSNALLKVHLPLIAPNGCAIRVGDETRNWMAGQCLIFDDSYEHELWNRGDETAAFLVLDIWNPGLTEIEKEALQIALKAVEKFGRDNKAIADGVTAV